MSAAPVFRMSTSAITVRAGAAAVWLAVVLGAAGPSFGQSTRTDPVVVVINGTPVHESELQMVDEIVGRNLNSMDPVERRDIITKMVIDTIVLSQAAKDRKIGDDADIQRRINFARNQGLMNHLLVAVGQQATTEEALRKTYNDVVAKAATEEVERHLRHVFFPFKDAKDDAAVKAAEEKAKAALQRINKGEDFAAVAADVSEDPVGKGNGGDYGWRLRGEMGKEYNEAADTLKKGEVTLIKTGVGWHVIKLEDQRPRKQPEFEQVRERVAEMVSSHAQLELVHKLRAEAKIERMDQPKEQAKEQSKDQPKELSKDADKGATKGK